MLSDLAVFVVPNSAPYSVCNGWTVYSEVIELKRMDQHRLDSLR
jgi:hypothetical protein